MHHQFAAGVLLCCLANVLAPGALVTQEPDSTNFDVAAWLDWYDSRISPNQGGKSLSSPTGWGSGHRVLGAGMGYRYLNVAEKGDGGGGVVLGLGDPASLNMTVGLGITDISEFGEPTVAVKVSRHLSRHTAVAVGVENLWDDIDITGGADRAVYAVLSHTLPRFEGSRPFTGRVSFSVGAGNGRFAETPANGNSNHEDGTWAFGNVAVELLRDLNVIAEWDGNGLNSGLSWAFTMGPLGLGFTGGFADLTGYTADDPRFVFGAGGGFRF